MVSVVSLTLAGHPLRTIERQSISNFYIVTGKSRADMVSLSVFVSPE